MAGVLVGCTGKPEPDFTLILPTVENLPEPARVSYGGIEVGYVTNYRLEKRRDDTVVVAGDLFLTEPMIEIHRADILRLKSDGLLSGYHVAIEPSNEGSSPPIKKGARIQVLEAPSLEDALDQMSEILKAKLENQHETPGEEASPALPAAP